MIAYSVTIQDRATPVLERLLNAVKDRRALNADLGRRGANELRAHFRDRQMTGPRNKFGASSSGFWSEIRDAVNDADATEDGATIKIAHPAIAQKVFGGTITKDDKLLAIPARMEAYGKSPRLFSNLKAIFFRSGAGALISTDAKLARGQKRLGKLKETGMVWYWLVDSVTQAKDPNALPEKEKMEAALLDTLEKHVNRLTKPQ